MNEPTHDEARRQDDADFARFLVQKAEAAGVSPETLARQFCADAITRIVAPLEKGQPDPSLQADLDLLVEQFAEHFTDDTIQ